MSLEYFNLAVSTAQTRQAAAACLQQLAAQALERQCQRATPYNAIQAIAQQLAQDGAMKDKVWIVHTAPTPAASQTSPSDGQGRVVGHRSAWPLWFKGRAGRFELPLLYVLRSASVAGLRAAVGESAERGIVCNDAKTSRSRWPKSVQPALALWLAGSANAIPYDPASGQEALAIVRAAMQALYIDDEPGFFYLSLHDEGETSDVPSDACVDDAYKGMYRLLAAPDGSSPALRLLGAGQALAQVVQAADLLQTDWGIATEVWSCPSYTRLAREAHAAERWNMLHPLSAKQTPHIHTCLGSEPVPVLAVTGYGRHIADQIGGFVAGHFVAMGADSNPHIQGLPSAPWIVLAALKALGDAGTLPMRYAQDALRRYGLC